MVKVESVGREIACGKNAANISVCVGDESDSVFIPDTLGTVEETFITADSACGVDEDGLKCWALPSTQNTLVNGLPRAAAIPTLLKSLDPKSVRFDTRTICGLESKTGYLKCQVPGWKTYARRAFKVRPPVPIRGLAVSDLKVCWIEGDDIHCKNENSTDPIQHLSGVTEIAIAGDSVCARSMSEAKCIGNSSEIILGAEFVTASRWYPSSFSLCALTIAPNLSCVSPATGLVPSFGFGAKTPARFQTANPDFIGYWNEGTYQNECALEKNGIVTCWKTWEPEAQVAFSEPVVELLATPRRSTPCVKLQSGKIECRFGSGGFQSLGKSSMPTQISLGSYGRCYWNTTGMICENDMLSPLENIRDVALGDSNFCAVGTERSHPGGPTQVWCKTGDDIESKPFSLLGATHVAMTPRGDQTCATSDGAVQCTGVPYVGGFAPASVDRPSKLRMEARYACGLDNFGFFCWGDLSTAKLDIPLSSNETSTIRDFASGPQSICVVLQTGEIKCWGTDAVAPPVLKNATSIAGDGGSFCATDGSGLHCWGSNLSLPE